jgi:hypothetical protein
LSEFVGKRRKRQSGPLFTTMFALNRISH